MIRYSALSVLLASGLLASLPTTLYGQLESVDEAIKASQTTGRPIFAMAGNKT
ncbi:MAG: hypothetical protein GX575_14535 [Candidatus Anammoximicrobium sp.]|nr:hypothetical protein [Candidatus Anammoximicrobium sp.]